MTASASSKEAIADRLAEARERTLELVEPLDDEQLNRVYSPILSPLAWDLGHIANFEELWLVQRIGGREPMRGELGRLYDAIESPRRVRGELPILRDSELRAYLADVRERTLEVLDEVEIGDGVENPLLREGFVYEMLIAHEQQHNETMLQLLQMVDGYEPVRAEFEPAREAFPAEPEPVAVAAAEYLVGAPATGFAYDNERPRHTVELAAFEIDRTPVTNAAYISFMEDTGADPPMYWQADTGGGDTDRGDTDRADTDRGDTDRRGTHGEWLCTARGKRDPVDPAEPVAHVSWAQADAFARWAGKRPPTEFEWEAASGQLEGVGHGWEWTSSEFQAYPGFRAFPYGEYSEVFFGDEYKVLRGASWATHPNVVRPSFRNWDLPQRAQIFTGIRCARDA